MNQITKHEPQAQAVEQAESRHEPAALLNVIERAALNPNVDIDKMERLLEMQERVVAKQAKAAYTGALAAMQPHLPIIVEKGAIKNGSGEVQSTYALWEDINEAIKPVLAEYGFALSFRADVGDGTVKATGILSHRDGHSEETTITLPFDSSGAKNAVQAVASSVSYGKRYAASALLNLTSRGEDDDGQNAGSAPIDEDQVRALQEGIEGAQADIEKFCAYFKIESLKDLPANRLKDANKMLAAKRASAGGK